MTFVDRSLEVTYGPKIAEYILVNEDEKGIVYDEMSYILIEDIPEEYVEKFTSWMNENKLEICVLIKIQTQNNQQTEYIEKKAVNVVYWEKWWSAYS